MRFHIISLPHTQTTPDFITCAYTQKVVKLAEMMKSLVHEVYLYSGEHNTAPCTEHITVVTDAQQAEWFGEFEPRDAPNVCQVWDPASPPWATMNANTVTAMRDRVQPGDFVGLCMGLSQSPIARAYPSLHAVETGIGYYGIDFANHLVFESYAWMHHIYGKNNIELGRNYDCVIPNSFRPEDFPFSEEKDDYFLYIGRICRNKGIEIAVEASRRLGVPLVVAGPGGRLDGGMLQGVDVEIPADKIEYVGSVDVEERGKLMSRARAVFVPTIYIEPFGGTNVEAQLCGTPVITSDFGAFPETVIDHVTGYRCRTIGEYTWAAEHVDQLDPMIIRHHAVADYSTDRVRFQYQAYFEQLAELHGAGFYTHNHAGTSVYERYVKES